jgi:hypothetical protein
MKKINCYRFTDERKPRSHGEHGGTRRKLGNGALRHPEKGLLSVTEKGEIIELMKGLE